MSSPVFVLGGYQTDFARHWSREGKQLSDLLQEATQGVLSVAKLEAQEVQAAHVGNFMAEAFCHQGHLGALLLEAMPALDGIPTARHEAACASGSIAMLSALAELQSGRHELVLVLGVEWMRNLPGFDAQALLGAAALVPDETDGVLYPWASIFDAVATEYDERYGLKREHLTALAQSFFQNAKRNPNAQTRSWRLTPESFSENDLLNPIIAGRLRKQDCSQLTDGAAAILLVSERFATKYAQERGQRLEAIPRILGVGHRSTRITLRPKLTQSRAAPYVFPQVRRAITDAFQMAGLSGVEQLDAIECHDCFTPTAYMAIDHLGITPPGESFRAIEDGSILFSGRLPINPSGGLMGGGHPVGATGVRMLVDSYKQLTQTAGDYQVPNAKCVATLNIGGSTGTTVCTILGRG